MLAHTRTKLATVNVRGITDTVKDAAPTVMLVGILAMGAYVLTRDEPTMQDDWNRRYGKRGR